MDGKSIDNARRTAITRARGGHNFVTAALAAALRNLGAPTHIGRMNPFKNLGRFPTQMEFMRHLSPGGISMTCRSDLEAMFGPLKRPKSRPGASSSLRFDQVQRRDRRRKKANYVNYAALRKARRKASCE